MHTIVLDDDWIQTAQLFGDVESVIKQAVKAYSIDQCQRRIQQAAEKITEYTHAYHCSYEHFTHAIQTDDAFLERIQADHPVWEEDAIEWKYWIEEQQGWQLRLHTISER